MTNECCQQTGERVTQMKHDEQACSDAVTALYDVCHEKTDLNVFVVVKSKEDGCAHPSFGMTPTFQNLTQVTS